MKRKLGWPTPPPWVWLFCLLSTVLGMVVILHVAHRQVEVERTARLEAEQVAQRQSAANHRATCVVINAQIAVYDGDPPITATGKSAALAWHDLGALFKCSAQLTER